MRSLSTPAILLALVFTVGCAPDTPTVPMEMLGSESAALSLRSASNCDNVGGAVEGNFAVPDGFTMQGRGTAVVTVVGLDRKGSKGQGAIHSVVMHRISTPWGTILTSDEGVLAPVEPPLYRLNHRWTITAGRVTWRTRVDSCTPTRSSTSPRARSRASFTDAFARRAAIAYFSAVQANAWAVP